MAAIRGTKIYSMHYVLYLAQRRLGIEDDGSESQFSSAVRYSFEETLVEDAKFDLLFAEVLTSTM